MAMSLLFRFQHGYDKHVRILTMIRNSLKKAMKKLFIKLCKLFGYQIIDQNSFFSPTLNKELNENLSTINKESIILPLGQVNITKK